ncbi:MAG: HAD family hydrolase [Candidatus Puniceispirillaceae bacterium]
MIKSLVFDKDGVLLDLIETWLPVMQGLAEYTLSLVPDDAGRPVSRAMLLSSVGINDDTGRVDPNGLFARGSFFEVRAVWQTLLPAGMINLQEDESYRSEVKKIVRELGHGNAVAKGDLLTPLTRLSDAGFKLAVLTNDSEGSARQGLEEVGVAHLFDPIIGADSGHGGKPDPRGLLHCCAMHGSAPGETLMIGDTSADYDAAINAAVGGFVCIADDPAHRPDAAIPESDVIALLSDLPDLLVRRGDMT